MLEAEGAEATGTDAAAGGAPDASGTDIMVAAAEQPGLRYRAQPHSGRCVSTAQLCCFTATRLLQLRASHPDTMAQCLTVPGQDLDLHCRLQ